MNSLTDDEIVKWACLFECLATLNDKCDKGGIDFDFILKKKLKPHIINEYINGRFPDMCNALETGGYLGSFLSKLMYNDKE